MSNGAGRPKIVQVRKQWRSRYRTECRHQTNDDRQLDQRVSTQDFDPGHHSDRHLAPATTRPPLRATESRLECSLLLLGAVRLRHGDRDLLLELQKVLFANAADVHELLKLIFEDDRLNVYAGELEVRPPAAPTTGDMYGGSVVFIGELM